MKLLTQLFALSLLPIMSLSAADTVHEFTVKDIEGEDVALADYQDKVLLIVNVASRCGYTRQYTQLQEVHEKLKEEGLVVMGFPANNYGGQEPGSNDEIKLFCTERYDVSFPMFSKVSVDGDDQTVLFQFLTSAENPDFTGRIKWNFEKILVGKDGKVLRRFRSGDEPDSDEVLAAIQEALKSEQS